jgi:hypothetical protein
MVKERRYYRNHGLHLNKLKEIIEEIVSSNNVTPILI